MLPVPTTCPRRLISPASCPHAVLITARSADFGSPGERLSRAPRRRTNFVKKVMWKVCGERVEKLWKESAWTVSVPVDLWVAVLHMDGWSR